ncbi:hypothetical protein OSTOST_19675 [Ostertagia ostertagi]
MRPVPSGYHGDYGDCEPSPHYPPVGGTGCVLMIYGIDHEKLNCEKLFNLLCQYGNVLRIRFMATKKDTVMAELGTPTAVGNAIKYLQGITLFGLTLQLKPKHSGCRARRDVFAEREAPELKSVTVFVGRSDRSSSGIVELESIEKANEALALVNHTPVVSPLGKTPYIVKLAYATPSRRHGDSSEEVGGGEGGGGGPPRGGPRGGFRGSRRNDRKALTEEIEKAIERSHAEDRVRKPRSESDSEEADAEKDPSGSNDVAKKVTTVIPNSPAAEGGLRADDMIIQYGDLHAGNFKEMKEVSTTTAKLEGQKLRVTVLRNGRPVRLEIFPKRWSGNGILGCGIVPTTTSDVI